MTRQISPEAASALRPALPGLADEIIASIAQEVPEYSRAMEGTFGKVVRHGVEVALGRFLDVLGGTAPAAQPARETYVNLGRGELHAGRSLEALLSAYRVGARVAWRRFVERGVAAGLAPEVIYQLGEAIFEYIDELSAESAEGFAAEQMIEAGERRRRRRRLVRALTLDPPPPEADLRVAAADAGWELPRSLALLVVAPDSDDEAAVERDAERVAREIGVGTIAAVFDGTPCAVVPDPDGPGRRRQVEAAVAGRQAALGPTVDHSFGARSLHRARAALELARDGRIDGDGMVIADDHLPALLLAADPEAAADLAARRLAPLSTLPPKVAGRLRATLRAWLDRPGQVQAVAAALHVHPQTVRYRVRQLRELFGDALEDPDARFELQLALRADR